MDFLKSPDELPFKSRIILYGAGEGGRRFKELIEVKRQDIKVECFVDDFRTGEKDGIKIISLKELKSVKPGDYLILVTSAHWRDIFKKFEQIKLDSILIVNQFLLFSYQIYTEEEEKNYSDNFENVKRLLVNETDKELFNILLNIRKPMPKDLRDPYNFFIDNYKGTSKEYLDFIIKEKINTIIEGGVGDGKNTKDFVSFLPSNGFVYGFEPFYDFYLESKYRNSLEKTSKVKVYPLALWCLKDRLMFTMNSFNKDGSKVVPSTTICENVKQVDAISIDEFTKENNIKNIDFIKLDIEGAELEVLKGAKKTLEKCRPQLAVCIYHKKEHLFEIPLFLNCVLDNYVYRIGHYCSSFWDTVWYAIPREYAQ